MGYVSVSCQFYTLALLSRFDFSFPPSISNRAGWKCKNTGRAGFTMLASWIRMLYMWRVYANILIRPRIIYSCSWKGSTIAHSFCFRTTLSESFDFFYSLKLANKCIYLTFLLSMYVSIVSTGSYLSSKSIGPELLCGTRWRSHKKNIKISYTSCKGQGLGSSKST